MCGGWKTHLKAVQRVIMRESWGGIVEPSGVALVCRYPPTSEWITGRTIYSKPLSGGALQIYERRRPFNRLAQSSLTAVVKPPFHACLPRLSPLLSRARETPFPLRLLPRLGLARLGSPAVLACQPFILYRSESVRFGPNIKGDGLPLARDRDAKSLRSRSLFRSLPYIRTKRVLSDWEFLLLRLTR